MPTDKEKDLSYKEQNGSTRVGDFLRNIVDSKDEILNVVSDLSQFVGKMTGIEALEFIGKKIDQRNDLSPEQKEIAKIHAEKDLEEAKIITEQRKHKEKQISDRWKYDMRSDNVASKNARPFTLFYLLFVISVLATLDSAIESFEVQKHWVELFSTLTTTAVSGYFVLRTAEKPGALRNGVTKMKNGIKNLFKNKNNETK